MSLGLVPSEIDLYSDQVTRSWIALTIGIHVDRTIAIEVSALPSKRVIVMTCRCIADGRTKELGEAKKTRGDARDLKSQ